MNSTSFDRRFWFILAGLGILFAAVVLAGSLAGLSAPRLMPEDGNIGSRGPLTLLFAESMQTESVEARLSFDPPLAGRFAWRSLEGRPGRMVSFWPDQPLRAGQIFTLQLSSGARSQAGMTLRKDHTWQGKVRPAGVLYLSPVDDPELWLTAPDNAGKVRLTDTGGEVFDYGVSPDGEKIVYSAYNEQSGVDLWEVSRKGGEPNLLLPCQSDWCINPAFSPDGLTIAYVRRRSGAMEGEGPGVPRVWLIDLSDRSTDILYASPDIGGHEPGWSPDGRFLAFFDGLSGGIRVLDMTSGTDFILPSQMGMTGEWSPDSRSMLYTDFMSTDSGPYVAVYLVDVEGQQIRRVLADDLDQVDYSNPVWTADGKQLAAALRLMTGSPTKQLWLISFDDSGLDAADRQAITNDPLYTYASYHWDPPGDQLVFQRLKIGSSSEKPQVGIWNRDSQETELLAEDAYQPGWIP